MDKRNELKLFFIFKLKAALLSTCSALSVKEQRPNIFKAAIYRESSIQYDKLKVTQA